MKDQDSKKYSIDWAAWLKVNGSRLFLFARQQARSAEDAEDIVQEALIRLVQKCNEGVFVGGAEQWLPYVYTSIRRLAADHARSADCRTDREQMSYQEMESEQSDPWLQSDVDHEDLRAQVEAQLKQLPPKFSEVIILKVWGEQTFKQIAESLEISLNTVASRYRYGMDHLRENLSKSNSLEI